VSAQEIRKYFSGRFWTIQPPPPRAESGRNNHDGSDTVVWILFKTRITIVFQEPNTQYVLKQVVFIELQRERPLKLPLEEPLYYRDLLENFLTLFKCFIAVTSGTLAFTKCLSIDLPIELRELRRTIGRPRSESPNKLTEQGLKR
jgi:hypothetical protein